jgi:hypothetical protein
MTHICSYNLMVLTMDEWNECLIYYEHVFNFIYIQANDVKLLKWLSNNNNYDMM